MIPKSSKMQDPQEFQSDFSQSLLMKMQNSGEPRGSPRIMIRYIINKNALSKDFTPFCDENCKNRTQAMVNEDQIPFKIFSATSASNGSLIE